MFGDHALNKAADEAITNTMYRFTFAVIGDNRFGLEGRGIGTGIGIRWNRTFLILTAAHTMQTTPDERRYFLLPGTAVAFQESGIHATTPRPRFNRRVQLVSQQSVLDDEWDLAAFVLPEQTDEGAQQHFYPLDSSHTTPVTPKQIGFLGYPEETRRPAGPGFAATPYSSFGELVAVPGDCNADSQIAVSYSTSGSVDAHGLSGAGLWLPDRSAGAVWIAGIRLAGLVTHVDTEAQVLLGLKVEELVGFLIANFQ